MTDSLAGKVLFITGASRGIGKAIALRAAADGARVAIAAKSAKPHPKLEGTIFTAAEEIEAAGGFTQWANEGKIRIKRAELPQEIKVNLKKYYEGGELSANIPLDEGDIVLVKSSFFF